MQADGISRGRLLGVDEKVITVTINCYFTNFNLYCVTVSHDYYYTLHALLYLLVHGIHTLLYLLVHGIHIQRVPEVLAIWIPGRVYGFQVGPLDFLWILITLVTGLLHFGLSN